MRLKITLVRLIIYYQLYYTCILSSNAVHLLKILATFAWHYTCEWWFK